MFQNPMFSKPKPASVAKAEAETAAATGAVPPKASMIQGGPMNGMLKMMGLDPSVVDETAGKLVGAIEDLNSRLDRIEANQTAQTETVARIESMLKDMLEGLAR